ncbi:hypothetical protein [Candidatus Palauibacter sp.]|uniref:hypothetical protein n=1 Tax=Candidatus Palauibacter sp. TaxID=3101350 RepID=UPI003B51E8E4
MVFALWAVAACSGERDVATNPAEATARLDRVPLAVIGDETDDPLHGIVGALFLGDTLVLTDRTSLTLRFYSRTTGELLHSVGGEGEGPGEFQRVGRPHRVGDRLYVWDRGLLRLSAFGTDGEFHGSTTIEPVEPYNFMSFVGLFPDGSSLLGLHQFNFDPVREPTVRRAVYVLMTYDANGAFTDSLGSFVTSDSYAEPFGRGGEQMTSAVFGRDGVVDVLGGRYYVMDNVNHAVAIFDQHGESLGVLLPDPLPEPVPVTQADVELVKSRGSELMRKALDEGRMPVPEHFPPYGWSGRRSLSALRTTGLGAIWVLDYGGVRDSTPTWTVYSPEGTQVMRVRSPDEVSVLAVDGDIAAVLAWNEFDVQTIEVRRILR